MRIHSSARATHICLGATVALQLQTPLSPAREGRGEKTPGGVSSAQLRPADTPHERRADPESPAAAAARSHVAEDRAGHVAMCTEYGRRRHVWRGRLPDRDDDDEGNAHAMYRRRRRGPRRRKVDDDGDEDDTDTMSAKTTRAQYRESDDGDPRPELADPRAELADPQEELVDPRSGWPNSGRSEGRCGRRGSTQAQSWSDRLGPSEAKRRGPLWSTVACGQSPRPTLADPRPVLVDSNPNLEDPKPQSWPNRGMHGLRTRIAGTMVPTSAHKPRSRIKIRATPANSAEGAESKGAGLARAPQHQRARQNSRSQHSRAAESECRWRNEFPGDPPAGDRAAPTTSVSGAGA